MKKITRLLGLGFLSVAALSSFTSCGKTGFKVGLLCLHGQTSTYDNNFIQAFEEACQECGLSKDQYDIRTDVAEDYNKIYTATKEWAEDGYALICADSFGHQYGMIDVAKEYKDTQFCHATGTLATVNPDVKNFHNGFASIYEGRYLAGIVAGRRMIEDINANKYTPDEAVIGYVGAYPYAEVISGYTSFFLGARSVFTTADDAAGRKDKDRWDSKLNMKVIYTSSWYDYRAEKEAAETLIVKYNCKLISQHADSMGSPLACNNHKIPNVSYNISTKKTCGDTYLVSSKINWKSYFTHAIKLTRNKESFRTDYCGTLGDDHGVELCEYGDSVSEETKQLVEKTKQQLIDKDIFVYDTSKFTVTKTDKRNKFSAIEFEDDGKHIKSYKADVVDNGDYVPETEVIKEYRGTHYVAESCLMDVGDWNRSAPYFDLIIDGIDPLN